ncbi:Alpha-soluble NSF attachment protein-like protein [Drosera capensis]
MADQAAKGEEFEKKAEKKLNGWAFLGNKYEDAAELYEKAANSYKLGKLWDQAGAVYIKLADCNLKMDSKHEAASAYVDSANSYKKTSPTQAISSLVQAVNIFSEIGRFSMAARYCKDIGELYEQVQNFEQAIVYYERAAEFFQGEEVTTSANQCKQKVAQFSAQLEQYPKAIEIFEEIARHSINNNLLKYGVRGHLLNAGICQLCKGDPVAISNALDKYQVELSALDRLVFPAIKISDALVKASYIYMQDLDPTFSRTRDYQLLADLAAAVDEGDIGKFTAALKEYDSMSPLDGWRTTLLLRVKEALKAKEDDDDLT